MTKSFVLAGVLAAGPVVLSADQAPVNPRAHAQLGALRPAESANPYRELFGARTAALRQTFERQQAASKQQPRVVCGMVLIPMDPSIDPKILIAPKTDGVEHTIRAIEPPICKAR